MAFELPPLPYAYDALEPVIDKETMQFHHDKHHAAYTNKLNEGVEKDASLQGKTIEDILGMISSQPPLVRNNGGGFWNHDFFWKTMAAKSGQAPSGKLAEAIDRDFGGCGAVRLGLGMADRGRQRQVEGDEHAEPGQPADGRRQGAGYAAAG
jgi:Fe-Mn family superoxide dismutase